MWQNLPVTRYSNKEDLIRRCVKPTDTVLDVGFWGQAHVHDRATWPHKRMREITPEVWGVDLEYDESVLEHKERYQHASAEDFSFDKKFDVIIALDLIEHITNPGLFLACAKKHLMPGGRIIISTPNTFNLFAIAGKLSRSEPPINSDHTFYFNKPTLYRLFEKCGWSVTSFGVVYTLGDLHVESLKKKILNMLYAFLARRTDKFYETLVVEAVPKEK